MYSLSRRALVSGLSLGGLSFGLSKVAAAVEPKQRKDGTSASISEQCQTACVSCMQVCQETLHYCLSLGGRHTQVAHIRCLLDCIEICKTSSAFMLNCSAFVAPLVALCADICSSCAASCERLDSVDYMLLHCASTCQRAAEKCRTLANMLHC